MCLLTKMLQYWKLRMLCVLNYWYTFIITNFCFFQIWWDNAPLTPRRCWMVSSTAEYWGDTSVVVRAGGGWWWRGPPRGAGNWSSFLLLGDNSENLNFTTNSRPAAQQQPLELNFHTISPELKMGPGHHSIYHSTLGTKQLGDIILQNTKIFMATWYQRACYYCGLLYYSECYYWRYYSCCCCSLGEFVLYSV